MSTSARPLVVDCDPGIDDAVALLVAAASPQVDLLGVTTVCGNVDLAHTTRNALAVLELAGRDDVPVAPGADRPLVRSAPRRAAPVHGVDGLGGVDLPEPARAPERVHAVEFLAAAVRRSARPVTLVAVGPLTNVALFYALHPAEAARLARVVVLAGSVGAGDTTPAAEFNAWFDPEAAHRVLTDPGLPLAVPTVQIGLEISYQTAVDPGHLARMRGSGPVGALVADALGHYLLSYRELLGRDAVPVHDAVAVAEAVSPGLVTTQRAHVEVDCAAGPSRGSTVIEPRLAPDAPATAEVGVDVDVAGVVELVTDRVASYGGGPRPA